MEAGIPVVATAVGSLPEVLRDGALLVAPGDADALAGALTEVLTDETRASALAAAGRVRAGAFSWASCGRGLLAVYREAAASRGGRRPAGGAVGEK